jgi:Bacterial Ig-like domain (group 2)
MASASVPLRVLILASVLLIPACGDSVGPHGVASVRLSVTAPNHQLYVGHFAAVNAEVLDDDGNVIPFTVLPGNPLTWAVSDTNIASFEARGEQCVLTGRRAGAVFISANSYGVKASTLLTVIPVLVDSVTVSPSTLDLSVGMTTVLQAMVWNPFGRHQSEHPVTWTSSNQGRATVSADGVVSGVAAGTVTITATVEEHSGTSTVNVVN